MAKCETSNGTDNLVGSPRWAADFINPQSRALAPFPARVDPSQFVDDQAITVQLTAAAAQGATAIVISSITLPLNVKFIPAGTALYFGGAKIAILSEQYTNENWNTNQPSTSDVNMNVEALPTALAGTESAVWEPYPSRCQINSGTLVSRTYAQRDAGAAFHPAVATDDEFYLLAFDILDANMRADAHLVRSGIAFGVKENYLPQWASLNTPLANVNEVQLVTLTGATGGDFVLWAIVNGVKVFSPPIAYNANLATIQVAVNDIFGAGPLVVATGSVTAITLTYSGAGFLHAPQPLIGLDTDALVGYTAAQVSRTTAGQAAGPNPLLVRLRQEYNCFNGFN